MIHEYAITPEALFTVESTTPEVTGFRREILREFDAELKRLGVVRNLRDGIWAARALSGPGGEHILAKTILKSWITRNRLCKAPAIGGSEPATEMEWVAEALLSHRNEALTGIFCSSESGRSDPLVASFWKPNESSWWPKRNDAPEIARTLTGYRQAFGGLFRCSTEIMFIDRYLNPTEHNYREFRELLRFAQRKSPSSQISIHRMLDYDTTTDADFQNLSDAAETQFTVVRRAIREFASFYGEASSHERFLITNLAVVKLTNGFDTDPAGSRMHGIVLTGDYSERARRFFERDYGSSDVRSRKFAPKTRSK